MSEIEKQFFDTFGIEPKWGNVCNCCDCQEFKKAKSYNFDEGICCGCYHCTDGFYYPQITDRILLELICSLNKSRLISAVNLNDFNYEDLKNTILRKNITILKNEFINNEIRNNFKHQVQALFKENN